MRRALLFLLLGTLFSVLNASPHIRFSKNGGQWNDSVLFKADLGRGTVFLEKQQFTFLFYSEEWANSKGHNRLHHDLDHDGAHHHRAMKSEFTHHAYRVVFVGSNPNVTVLGQDSLPHYENYFLGNNRKKWATHVGVYASVRYKNLYPGIDLLVYQSEDGFKYDFELAPGANPDDIVMQIDGALSVGVNKQKGLDIVTAVNQVSEHRPFSYTKQKGKSKKVACAFAIDQNKVSFKLGRYNTKDSLVIDPELVFSTYSGSTVDNWGFTATYDGNGDVYSGGVIFGQSYPFQLGPFQTQFNGGSTDVAIFKVDESGTKMRFATYIGGTSSEMPQSMIVNSRNELVLYGTTGSPDFPITSTAYSSTFKGGDSITYDFNGFNFSQGTDIFVLKMTADGGELTGGTFYGGSKNDGLNYKAHLDNSILSVMHGNDSLYANYGDGARGEVTVDFLDNIYIGSCTFSSNCPIEGGAQSLSKGKEEGLLLKFNADLSSLIWSSYVGGSEDDAVYSVDVDKNQNLYFTGGSSSKNIATSASAYKKTYQGGNTDAFVGKVSSSGTAFEGLTYFGSDVYDQSYFVRVDKKLSVYIYGQTRAQNNTLIFNAGYNNPNSGQFLAKFSNTLDKLEWSTVFGSGNGKPNISPTAFSVDLCHRIYLAGSGRDWPYFQNYSYVDYSWSVVEGTKSLPITTDAYQSTTDGQDFYFMVLTENAQALDYATFLGETRGAAHNNCVYGHNSSDHVDGGTARFDKQGNIYQAVCASCGGCQGFPIKPKPGAVSTINGDDNCNNAVLRFKIHYDMVESKFENPDVLCNPYKKQFINKSVVIDTQKVKYTWIFGDGTPDSNEKEPIHTFPRQGSFHVCLAIEDLTSCNLHDTICKTIVVSESTKFTTLPKREICLGDSVQIGINPSDSLIEKYRWSPIVSLSNDTIPNPFARPTETTTYVLTISNTDGCTRKVEQTVMVNDFNKNPYKLSYTIEPTDICDNVPTTVTLSSNAPTRSFIISNRPDYGNNLLKSVRDSVLTLFVTKDTVLYLRILSKNCQQFDTARITLHSAAMVNINLQTDSLCSGASVQIKAATAAAASSMTYNWQPANAITSGQGTLEVSAKTTKTTIIKLTATNPTTGCVSSDSITLVVDSPSVSLKPQAISCFAQTDGKIVATAQGLAPFKYKWNDNVTTANRSLLAKGVWSLTMTDRQLCTATASVTIIEPDTINIVGTLTKACNKICNGQIALSITGGTPPFLYEWSNLKFNERITNLCPGIYSVTVTDSSECVNHRNFEIVEDISMTVDADTKICIGSQTDLKAKVSPSTALVRYQWMPSTSIEYGQTSATVNVRPDTTTTYIITATNKTTNCQLRDSIRVIVDNPRLTLHAKNISCFGKKDGRIELSSAGIPPISYQWSDGDTARVRSSLGPSNLIVNATDSLDCKTSKEITILEPDSLYIQTIIQPQSCPYNCNGKASIVVAGGVRPYTYRWYQSADSVAKNLCKGQYTVTVTDANNCRKWKTIDIAYQESIPTLKPQSIPPYLYAGQKATLYALPQAEEKVSYRWYPEAGLGAPKEAITSLSSDTTMFFTVEATNQFGCTASDTLRVEVRDFICGEPFIFVPNTFTPNGDSKNDLLPVASKVISSLDFKIFDRWGEIVFQTTDPTKAWDGTFKSMPVSAGVYVFHLKAMCLDGKPFEKKGSITVIR